MCRLLNLTNVEDSGCTSLRVHLGSLLASGPALALVLHLPVKCGSRTLDPGISLFLRPTRRTGALLFHRVVSVSDGKITECFYDTRIPRA